MKIPRWSLVFLIGAALLSTSVGVRAQQPQPDVEHELEDAKALYREARFAQAIAKLQLAIAHLDGAKDPRLRRGQADAHLHLALSYVALNDPTAAKESLKAMLRLDRDRRLDPEVYAPKVVELFEESRAELARESPATADTATPPPAPLQPASGPSHAAAAPKKRGGSKAPLILLGAGGAAAAGIAVAGGGGSVPTPTTIGSNSIVLVGLDPPAGTSISLSRGPRVLVSLLASKAGPERGVVHLELRGDCTLGSTDSLPFAPGSGIQVRIVLNIPRSIRGTGCEGHPAPLRFPTLRAVLVNERDVGFHNERGLVTEFFRANYTVVE